MMSKDRDPECLVRGRSSAPVPDFASLHPGYAVQ
jgi:hypothetical protein